MLPQLLILCVCTVYVLKASSFPVAILRIFFSYLTTPLQGQ